MLLLLLLLFEEKHTAALKKIKEKPLNVCLSRDFKGSKN